MHSSRGEQNQWLKRLVNPSGWVRLVKTVAPSGKTGVECYYSEISIPSLPFPPGRSHAMRAAPSPGLAAGLLNATDGLAPLL
jgi:hypothetical protein